MISATQDPKSQERTVIAISEGKPVGFARINYNTKRGFYDFSDLYTSPAFEGRGIGSSLMSDCQNFVRQQNAGEMYLNVLARDKTVREYYEKRGGVTGLFNEKGQFHPHRDLADPHFLMPTYLMQFKI